MKTRLMLVTALLGMALTSCNEKEEEDPKPEPTVVSTLDLTVTGSEVQCPSGNVYLFYSEECDLSYATVEGDGSLQPLVDASRPYNPVVKYKGKSIHPVSNYGTLSGGNLDTYSSVRYSQVHFDIAKLSTEYGQVKKGSTVLVVIVLNHEATRSWTFHAMTLRRDYVIHASLPDHREQTYVPEWEQNAKWWQVEGDEN